VKGTLFCLTNCPKCDSVKDLTRGLSINIITFPHSFESWTSEDIRRAEEHNVLEDLKVTAPVLVLANGTKLIGQLRIMRWLQHV